MAAALAAIGLVLMLAGAAIGLAVRFLVMTFPGMGGQQAPPQNATPAAQLLPGVQPGQTAVFTSLRAGNTIVNNAGLFIYSGPPAAGNLILSVSGTVGGGTDGFGNHYVFGVGVYDNSGDFFTQEGAGFITYGTGTLAAGWSANATIQNDSGGDLFLQALGTITANGIIIS